MKRILILLLCIFGLTFGYTQVRTVRVNVPSKVIVTQGNDYLVSIPDTTIAKYITMSYKDSILYINSSYELTEPIEIRITTPDSLNITTGRFYRINR